jgi:hypothetical protein
MLTELDSEQQELQNSLDPAPSWGDLHAVGSILCMTGCLALNLIA